MLMDLLTHFAAPEAFELQPHNQRYSTDSANKQGNVCRTIVGFSSRKPRREYAHNCLEDEEAVKRLQRPPNRCLAHNCRELTASAFGSKRGDQRREKVCAPSDAYK
ncbi:hypothetical protein AND_009303 [Anopheles darlingi]|uniref:Uncharacterized protein n=1 Tax=Anopheles darlingi TaxID=43151 RepID=W5J445_ANODA|nr:hypothetical protein AND_009303 [Anopheles darlingi]